MNFPSPLEWLPQYRVPVLVVATVAILFPVHHYIGSIENFRRLLARGGADERTQQIGGVLLQRGVGCLILGGVSALVAAFSLDEGPAAYGVTLDQLGPSLLISLVLIPPLFLLGLVMKRYPATLKGYPEMRIPVWTPGLLALNGLSWLVYLTGYEFMFRGFLLLRLNDHFGAWPAILVTTAIYGYSHLPKRAIEGFSTPVLGIMFGVTTLYTGSLVSALIVHVFIAFVTEIIATTVDPDMSFSWKEKR